MKDIEKIFNGAFPATRTPRSSEYKSGVRAALAFRFNKESINCPYKTGTAQADAFFAGVTEGHAIWRSINLKNEDFL